MSAQSFDLPEGRFIADERHVPEVPPFGAYTGDDAEQKLANWVSQKWNLLYQMKRGEQERLRTCELFYAGFHYENAWDNRENPVTNYCFSTVETIWPLLTEVRPRPEPAARSGHISQQRLDRIRDFAMYKMDSTGFDRVFRLCVRDLLKYGWCAPMIGWDSRGRALPRYLSPFDYYPDGATEDEGLEMFAIARPVPVRRLQTLFPKVADRIQPDNIASPSYECMVRPYLEAAGVLGNFSAAPIIGTLSSVIMEGDPAATTSGEYGIDTGSVQVFGQTAFLIQLFVRDYTTMDVRYEGTLETEHETGTLRNPHSITRQEPCCPSGWRMIPMLANGTILAPPLPVDPSLEGVPVVIGRNYEQGGRFYAKGELDEVIPIQRDINRTDMLIARALELQANPPVKMSADARLEGVDRAQIDGGELLKIERGAMMEYLQPQSLAESHFVRRASRRQDIQIVGGTPDSLAGQRPVGIEAGTALRQLNEQATSRARAKGPALLEWAAVLLQKMMRSDCYKSDEPIYYRGTDGTDMWMEPQDLRADDWDIRWAESSGNAQARQDRIDLNERLLQMGAIDTQQILDDLDYPDRAAILERVGLRQMQAQAAAANAAPRNGGS